MHLGVGKYITPVNLVFHDPGNCLTSKHCTIWCCCVSWDLWHLAHRLIISIDNYNFIWAHIYQLFVFQMMVKNFRLLIFLGHCWDGCCLPFLGVYVWTEQLIGWLSCGNFWGQTSRLLVWITTWEAWPWWGLFSSCLLARMQPKVHRIGNNPLMEGS